MQSKWQIPNYGLSPSDAILLKELGRSHSSAYQAGDAAQQARVAEAIAGTIRADAPLLASHIHAASAAQPVITLTGVPVPSRDVAQVLAAGLSRISGEIFQYHEQNGGDLTVTIEPRADGAANSNATPEPFGFHSDDAILASAYRTQRIALLGVINPPGTLTGFVPAELLLKSICPSDRETSFEPRFSMRAPRSFDLGEDVWLHNLPIFSHGADGELDIAWPTYATRPTYANDLQAEQTLSNLLAVLDRLAIDIPIDPGTWALFDNSKVLHRRSKILGMRRLLFRNYIRDDLTPLRTVTAEPGPIFNLAKLLASQPYIRRA